MDKKSATKKSSIGAVYSSSDSKEPNILQDIALLGYYTYTAINSPSSANNENVPGREEARLLLSKRQKIFLFLFISSIAVVGTLSPLPAFIIFLFTSNFLYLASIVLRLGIITTGHEIGRKHEHNAKIEEEDVIKQPQATLPRYTLLVPLYLEANIFPTLIARLTRLNYPQNKLQVLIILEEDDAETIKAYHAAPLPSYFHKVTVPECLPRTKAKACNYALQYATGDIVAIYDAEDLPDSNQLLKVAYTFTKYPDLAGIQCRLSYYNYDHNWLSRMFAIEYALQFDYILPALDHFHCFIPLGGTSNHFKHTVLKALGGWDSYNVTEDAELGLKAALQGYKIATIPSYTVEEATVSTKAWLKQRSRWMKGFLQTLLVYSREPNLFKKLGNLGSGMFLYTFFIGAITQVIVPLSILSYGLIAYGAIILPANLERSIMLFLMLNGALSLTSLVLTSNIITSRRLGWAESEDFSHLKDEAKGRIKFWWTFPLYFLLHRIAMLMALWQLIVKPYYWEKTTHGITEKPESRG
jgi:cellulose synthase/poly-beta-1,6-N-acetylglucosamine synthase-like glycosyltransferase